MCLLVNCSNRSGRDEGVRLFRVPAIIKNQGEETEELSRERRRKWLSAIHRDDLTDKILSNDRVCGRHFVSGQPALLWDRYNVDWKPTVDLGHSICEGEEETKAKAEANIAREERSKERRKRRSGILEKERLEKIQRLNESGIKLADIPFEIEVGHTEGGEDRESPEDLHGQKNCATQTEAFDYLYRRSTSSSHASQLSDAACQTEEFEYMFSLFSISDSKPFDKEYFRNDDDKVSFYTGLPGFDTLELVYKFVSPHVTRRSQSLNLFQEMVMILIKLRLDVPFQDLAYRFGVSKSTVSRTFAQWMVIMDLRLSPLIRWPEREELWRTMPQSFKYSFGNKTTVIIDCFEVFCVKPSNLLARAQTFSSYKHHNTVKVLIGITPQGTVSFVSQAWGGRTSDKYLTENCGMLGKLLPGDLVMADRGFTIHDGTALKYAELAIPAFTKGKAQLDPFEVEKTRGIAAVRIHVERVIGLLRRKYTILEGILPTELLTCDPSGAPEVKIPMIDRIIRVCSGLVNLCGPIVPFD